MLITICIPCFNSSRTIEEVVNSIRNEITCHNDDYQIILVNDGSYDNCFEVISKMCEKDKNIVGVDLSKNFGQTHAKLCGMKYLKGSFIIFMDDDGQHDAKDIYKFVDKINEGYDVVYGKALNKKHTLLKNITSSLSHFIQEKIGNNPKGVSPSAFSAYSKLVVDNLLEYKSPFVAIGPFSLSVTTKFANVDINHKERIRGSSGYTLKKLLTAWFEIMYSFSMVPLRLATFLGLIFSFSGFITAFVFLVLKLTRNTMLPGFTSTIIVLLIMSGVILVILGILGEYIGRMYMILCGMKQYCERKVINAN